MTSLPTVSENASLPDTTQRDISLYLEKDNLRVAGQNYAIISLISPTSPQKYERIAMKIKGVFNTIEEARKYAEKLHKADDTFDLHVVEMYAWVVVPPTPQNVAPEVHYSDQKLDELIAGHTEQQENAQIEFEKYKREMIEHGKKHAREAAQKELENQTKLLEETKIDEPEIPDLEAGSSSS